MFDQLFRYPAVLRRHRNGPLADERTAYLARLAARGSAPGTLLKYARYCLAIAHVVQATPHDRSFTTSDIDILAREWATGRDRHRRAAAPRWPHQHFRAIATEFLKSLGRWTRPPTAPRPYAREVDDFVTVQQRDRLRSPSPCRNYRWQIERFLAFLTQHHGTLAAITPQHVDAYFQHVAPRWNRVSLRSAAVALRIWFRYGEAKGWVRPGLANAMLVPRVYRDEGIPIGPTWDTVARLIANADGDTPLQRRNGAMLRLLAIYGLRSGEVRRLQVHDVDWQSHRIQITRSKSGHRDTFPLEPSVEQALRCYVRDARPPSDQAALFLTVRAPFRPLSAGALYDVVASHLPPGDPPRKGCGPHGLRHACARHLIEAGLSFKEAGDHLGHRSPDSTRIYPPGGPPSRRARGSGRAPMTLASAVKTYVALKQSLGAVFSVDARTLAAFVLAVGDVPVSTITPDLCTAFCRGHGPPTRFWSRKHEALRGLFRYLVGRGHMSHTPLPEPGPRIASTFQRYIYTHDDLVRLLQAGR